jgi:probable addiction module antidote protein
MTKTTTTIRDPATKLTTIEDISAYLEAALQDGDPQLVAAALGDIARAKGMSQIAREVGGQSRTGNLTEVYLCAGFATACQRY